MPYTQEELQHLDFYQNLINKEEQDYLNRRDLLLLQSAMSGSGDDGNMVLRNEEGSVLVFENPYTGEMYDQDPSNKLIINLKTENLTNDATINEILDRQIEEL
tara:strand:- start:152 stop:460 length:309 start_codon:yes stop_codon:yes gene_type:complete